MWTFCYGHSVGRVRVWSVLSFVTLSPPDHRGATEGAAWDKPTVRQTDERLTWILIFLSFTVFPLTPSLFNSLSICAIFPFRLIYFNILVHPLLPSNASPLLPLPPSSPSFSPYLPSLHPPSFPPSLPLRLSLSSLPLNSMRFFTVIPNICLVAPIRRLHQPGWWASLLLLLARTGPGEWRRWWWWWSRTEVTW